MDNAETQAETETPALTSALEEALGSAGMRTVAHVNEHDRAADFALAFSSDRLLIIRCVEQGDPDNHTALATMLSEGPFIWAALVYEHGDAPSSPGLIESFHVSELDRLVARLVELRGASG